MSGLARFFGSRDDVPGWARFFDAGGYRAFLEVLEFADSLNRLD